MKYDITSTNKAEAIVLWNGIEIQRLSDGKIKMTQIGHIRAMAREYAQQLSE